MTSHVVDGALYPVAWVVPRPPLAWRLVASVALITLAAAIGYVAAVGSYAFTVGAARYLGAVPERVACDNPGSRFGWAYEAINYPRNDDAMLLSYTPDPSNCGSQGEPAGSLVRAADGTRIAGWYIPAADRPEASGPTVVLVHGAKSNKSGMLDYAPAFHTDFNLVILDLRNSGRSGGDVSTGGVLERSDLRAMLDWLVRTKQPTWVAVVANSNGAAAALAEAADDTRVRALVLDSMHAMVERQLVNIIETEENVPAWPAAPAVIAGVSVRLGQDLQSVDPVRTIGRLAGRPVLLTHGSADEIDRPADSLDLNVAAAVAAGVDIQVEVCEGAGHGQVVAVCGPAWTEWVTGFLAAHGGMPS